MWKPIILDVECIVCNKTLQKICHDPREVSRKMGKITNRRSRTPNWSLDEKQYLLELIKLHKTVVVTKSNNGPNHSEEKDVAWNEILGKLAGKFGTKFSGFSIKKVKTQWQNMKRIAREEVTQNGPEFEKYTKQSLEVCDILDILKDGVLKQDNENFNETALSANIEIKTECIDEDMVQPSCSTSTNYRYIENYEDRPTNDENALESSSSSALEQISEANEVEREILENDVNAMKTVSVMTDISYINDITNTLLLRKELEEFIRSTAVEKQLKVDTLKDERQVLRAMRETAELNKIIAEQRLKHVLWIKKQEVAFTDVSPKFSLSGESDQLQETPKNT